MTDSFLIPDWPAQASVRSLVTTRAFGNLADHVGEEKSAVAARRAALRQHLPAEPHWLTQVHGNRCVAAEDAPAGVEADAAFAHSANQVCVVLTADCLPILFCDAAGTVVAAAHAGWRGLLGGVIEATIGAMAVTPRHLLAWLGPAIGPTAFEVGEEVRIAFVADDPDAFSAFTARPNGKWLCDLYMLARQRLTRLGVVRIFGGGRCTYGETGLFYSYRRERETGRMASLIWTV